MNYNQLKEIKMIKETEVIGHIISTQNFEWQKEGNIFVAEASSLPKHFDFGAHIWYNSDDTGFILRSEVTKKDLIFTFTGHDFLDDRDDQDYEVMGWLFLAVPALNKDILTEPVRALIIND